MSFSLITTTCGEGSEATTAASVVTYGADPTGVADSYAAFTAALAANTTIIFVPPGIYKMTDTWVIDRPVHIMGPTSRAGSLGATLVFNAGRDGIRVEYSGGQSAIIEDLCITTNVGTGAWAPLVTNYDSASTVVATAYNGFVYRVTSGTHSGASEPVWPVVAGGTVTESGVIDPVTWTAYEIAGVKIQASCTIREVLSTSFPGNGFSIFASTGDTPPSNANQTKLDKCQASLNRGWGFFTQGADANAGSIEACLAYVNGTLNAAIATGGFCDNSFLGNTYTACTAEANIGGAAANTGYAFLVPVAAASNSSAFYGCYCETSQLIRINGKASWHGEARGELPYGTGQIISPFRINKLYVLNDTNDNGTGVGAYTKIGNLSDLHFMEYSYGADTYKRLILQPDLMNGAGRTGVTAWNYYGTTTGSPYGYTLDTETTYGGGHLWIPRDFIIGAAATESVIGTSHSYPGKSNFYHAGGNIGTYPNYPYGMFFKEYVPYLNGGFLGYLNLQTGNPGTWAPVAKARYSRATAVSITLNSWDWYIGVTSTAATRTITLPTLGAEDEDTIEFVIKDESGAASSSNSIRIQPPGAELLDGVNTYKSITTPYAVMTVIRRNGKWFTVASASSNAAYDWTEGAITLAVSTTGSDAVTSSRPEHVVIGDYSATPFLTLQAALNALPRGLKHSVLIRNGAGTFVGAVAAGFVGSGHLRIAGTTALATLTTGVNAGTAGAGTTTTSLNKPAAVANWTASDLRTHFLVITSGGGSSGDADFPTVRPIISNTTTALAVDAVSGMDSTSVFQIVDMASIFTTAVATVDAQPVRLGFSDASAPIEVFGVKVNETGGYYGVRASRCTDITVNGLSGAASSGTAAAFLTCASVTCNDAYLTGSLYAIGCDTINAKRLVENAGASILVEDCQKAAITADASTLSATAVTMKSCVKATLGLNANSCTATPIDLQNIHNFEIDGALTGTNAGTTYGMLIAKSGQYLVVGATIAGAGVSDYLLEGSAGTWALLSARGADAARGGTTVMHWGSGLTFVRGTYSIESDLTIGGTFKNFGLDAALDPATKTIAASPTGTQLNGTVVAYQESHITSGGADYSVTMPYITVGANFSQLMFAAGYRGFLHNTSIYPIKVYPALVGPISAPNGTGTINGMAANAAYTLPAGCSVRWCTTGDNQYLMGDSVAGTAYVAGANGGTFVGSTTGSGVKGTGGATGYGVYGKGGTTSGAGIRGEGGTTGVGVSGEGSLGGYFTSVATNGNGVYAGGNGSGVGIQTQGGATGRGLEAFGGGGDAMGIFAQGSGAGEGIRAFGGATGNGVFGKSGATSGIGVAGEGASGGGYFTGSSGNARGLYAGGSGNGEGVLTQGGPNSGPGVSSTGGGPNGRGGYFIGVGTGDGIRAENTATGYALNVVSDTTSPVTAAVHIEPQNADPTTASLGDVCIRTTSGIMKICTSANTFESLIKGTLGATDNRLVRSDGTGTATLQATGITIDDADGISGHTEVQNIQTGTTYTFTQADTGKAVIFTNAAAVTVTVPQTLTAGWSVRWEQRGAGQVAFNGTAVTAATLNNRQTHAKSAGQYAVGGLAIYTSGTPAVATLFGDTAA